jgi:hypothetical protein
LSEDNSKVFADAPNGMTPHYPWLPWTRLEYDRVGWQADLEYLAELADRRRQMRDPPRAAAHECGRKSCLRARDCLGPYCIHPAMQRHVANLARKAEAAAKAEREAARERARGRRRARGNAPE